MNKQQSFHDSFVAQTRIKESSDRTFGLTIGIAVAIIGGINLYANGLESFEVSLFAIALLLFFLALAAPRTLKPANKLWLAFGRLLFVAFSPIMMAAIFALAFIPVGLMLQLFGKDSLHLKTDSRAESYWLERNPPGPAPESMKYQF